MKLHFIDEPELEFGALAAISTSDMASRNMGRSTAGLASAPQSIRVGVVGAAQDVERLRAWIDRCRAGVDAKKSKRTTLFVAFPGFGASDAFCDFVVDDRLADIISGSDLRDIGNADQVKFQVASIERFRQGTADLIEKANAHVVLCLLPESFVRRIDVPSDARDRAAIAATTQQGRRSQSGTICSRLMRSNSHVPSRLCARQFTAAAFAASRATARLFARCRTKQHEHGTSFARFTTRLVESRGGWPESQPT